MQESTTSTVALPSTSAQDVMTEILRDGAQQMLAMSPQGVTRHLAGNLNRVAGFRAALAARSPALFNPVPLIGAGAGSRSRNPGRRTRLFHSVATAFQGQPCLIICMPCRMTPRRIVSTSFVSLLAGEVYVGPVRVPRSRRASLPSCRDRPGRCGRLGRAERR